METRKEVIMKMIPSLIACNFVQGIKADKEKKIKGTNSRIFFTITGLTTSKVQDGNTVVVNTEVEKKSVCAVMENIYNSVSEEPKADPSLEEVLEALAEIKPAKFFALANKDVPGFAPAVNTIPGVTEDWGITMIGKGIMAACYNYIQENTDEKSSDPFLQVKREFCGMDKFSVLQAMSLDKIHSAVEQSVQTEIDRLMTLKGKVREVKAEDYKAFLAEKNKANGIDPKTERVRLKAEKKSAATVQPEENKAPEA